MTGFNPQEVQPLVYREQKTRLQRLIDYGVEYIVSDSPILLSAIYGDHLSKEFIDETTAYFLSCPNKNFLLERGNGFTPFGRVHSLEESKRIDQKILDCLLTNNVDFTRITPLENAAEFVFNAVAMGS